MSQPIRMVGGMSKPIRMVCGMSQPTSDDYYLVCPKSQESERYRILMKKLHCFIGTNHREKYAPTPLQPTNDWWYVPTNQRWLLFGLSQIPGIRTRNDTVFWWKSFTVLLGQTIVKNMPPPPFNPRMIGGMSQPISDDYAWSRPCDHVPLSRVYTSNRKCNLKDLYQCPIPGA